MGTLLINPSSTLLSPVTRPEEKNQLPIFTQTAPYGKLSICLSQQSFLVILGSYSQSRKGADQYSSTLSLDYFGGTLVCSLPQYTKDSNMEPGSDQDHKPNSRLTGQTLQQPVEFGIYQERHTSTINQNCNVAFHEPHQHGRGLPAVNRKPLPQGSFIYERPASFRNASGNHRVSFEGVTSQLQCHECLNLQRHSFGYTDLGFGNTCPSLHYSRYTRRLTPPDLYASSCYSCSPPQTRSHSQHTSWDRSNRWTAFCPSENSSSAQLLKDDQEDMNTRPSTEGSTKSFTMGENLVKTPTLTEKTENIAESTSPSTPAGSPPQMPQQQHPTWSTFHDWLFIFTVCLAQFLSLATLAQTVAPLLIIGDAYGTQNPGQLAWFTASYSMTLGTFILPSGMHTDPCFNRN
jgi:hypothetical protein